MDAIAPNIPRYFSISTDTTVHPHSPIVFQQEEHKTQSAREFLTLLDTNLRDGAFINGNDTGRSLREIVTSIVSGYEAKRGIFLRIWECVLSILGYSTDTQKVINLSESILQVELIQDSYPPRFFTHNTQTIIDFLFNLPQEAATDFFTKQLREEGKIRADQNPTLAYCDSHDFSRPRNIHDLPVRDCMILAKELAWYFRAYENVFPTYGCPKKPATFPINRTLFQNIEYPQINAISNRLDRLLLAIAKVADLENDIEGAVTTLSQVDSVYDNNAGLSLMLRVVNKCLEQNDIINAYTAVAPVRLNNRDDVLLIIGNSALRMQMTENHFDILLSIALDCERDNACAEEFRKNFVTACVDQGHDDWAMKAALQMKTKHFDSSDDCFEKICTAHLQNKNCDAANKAIAEISYSYAKRDDLLNALTKLYLASPLLKEAAATIVRTSSESRKREDIKSTVQEVCHKCLEKQDYANAFIVIFFCSAAVSEEIVLKTFDLALAAKDYSKAVEAVAYVRKDAQYRIDLLKRVDASADTQEVKNTIQKEIAKYEAELAK